MTRNTFIIQLKQFAQSVDIIGVEELDKIAGEVVSEYLKNRYDVEVFALLEKYSTQVNPGIQGDGLRTFYTLHGPEWDQLIFSSDSSYMGQVSYVFDKGKSLWIQRSDGNLLGTSRDEHYIDFWHASSDVPRKLREEEDPETRTAIYIPLIINAKPKKRSSTQKYRLPKQKLGVMILEFRELINITNELKTEFSELGEIFSILYGLQRGNQLQRDNTAAVIDEIKQIARTVSSDEKHSYFISYSSENNDIADHVECLLRRHQRQVIRDESRFEPGNNIIDSIRQSISTVSTVVVIFSHDANESDYVRGEIEFARQQVKDGHIERMAFIQVDDSDPSILDTGRLNLRGHTRANRVASVARLVETETSTKS